MKKQLLFLVILLLPMVARADESGTFGVGYEDVTWTFTH